MPQLLMIRRTSSRSDSDAWTAAAGARTPAARSGDGRPRSRRGRRGLQRVGERDDLGRVDAFDGRREPVVVVPEPARPRLGAASRRARRPSSARSRGPIRQRGPVSSATRAALAVGSCSTSQVATRSATSGRCSSPDRPTTSTGTSRATSAAWMSAKWPAVRHSTAISPGGVPVDARWARGGSASQAISSAGRAAGRSAPGRRARRRGRAAAPRRLVAARAAAGEGVGEVEQPAAASGGSR